VTFDLQVVQDLGSGLKPLLAAVAAPLVQLTPDVVHQLHLLVEVEVWGRGVRGHDDDDEGELCSTH